MQRNSIAEPDRSILHRCLRALGADESIAENGGRFDDDNPEMDWTWHFQRNLVELPCTVQAPDGDLSTPWQMLYDLEPASKTWHAPFTLCAEEDLPTFQVEDHRFTWPDDEPIEVASFVARLMECFDGQLCAYLLKWYAAEDGADVACIVMTKDQANILQSELGEWFDKNFLPLKDFEDAPEFAISDV